VVDTSIVTTSLVSTDLKSNMQQKKKKKNSSKDSQSHWAPSTYISNILAARMKTQNRGKISLYQMAESVHISIYVTRWMVENWRFQFTMHSHWFPSVEAAVTRGRETERVYGEPEAWLTDSAQLALNHAYHDPTAFEETWQLEPACCACCTAKYGRPRNIPTRFQPSVLCVLATWEASGNWSELSLRCRLISLCYVQCKC